MRCDKSTSDMLSMVHTAQQRIADLQAELQIYQSQHTVKDQSLAQHEMGEADALLATRDVELDKLRCAMQAMKARMSQNDAASAVQKEELEAMRNELQRSKAELGILQCAVGLPEIPSVTLPEEMHAAANEAAKTRAQLAGSSSSMCGGKWCECGCWCRHGSQAGSCGG